MKQPLSSRLLARSIVLGTALLLVAAAQAAASPRAHEGTTSGTLLALKKTALGTILVDARGHTLYLFEKDRNGVSTCSSACAKYWPRLTSRGAPRAGKGVHASLLRVTRTGTAAGQVTYAGHPLYTFAGDKRAGQTTGEGLDNFGAEWYAVGPSGHKVERAESESGASGASGDGGYGSGGGYDG